METLKQQFGHVFSSSSFTDLGRRLIGKFGNIEQLDDGTYDCWFIGKDLQPLHGRRLGILERSASKYGFIRMLDGEAYIQTKNKEHAQEIALLMGVRRRKQVSEETRQKLADRMRKFHVEHTHETVQRS